MTANTILWIVIVCTSLRAACRFGLIVLNDDWPMETKNSKGEMALSLLFDCAWVAMVFWAKSVS